MPMGECRQPQINCRQPQIECRQPQIECRQPQIECRQPRIERRLHVDYHVLIVVVVQVHADLSEYNMLYHEQRLYIIDVAQAIDRSHPQALNHLEKDCQNVTTFFTRQGVPNILSVPELVEFVTGNCPAIHWFRTPTCTGFSHQSQTP